jgi:hypothetical protein
LSPAVPWQRVINAQGRVSTHPEDAGTWRQIERLRAEGIAVADDGTLRDGLAALRWEPDQAQVDALALSPEAQARLDLEDERRRRG